MGGRGRELEGTFAIHGHRSVISLGISSNFLKSITTPLESDTFRDFAPGEEASAATYVVYSGVTLSPIAGGPSIIVGVYCSKFEINKQFAKNNSIGILFGRTYGTNMWFKAKSSIIMTQFRIGITAKEDVTSLRHFGNYLTYPLTNFVSGSFGFGMIGIRREVPDNKESINVRSDTSNSSTSASNGIIWFIDSAYIPETRGAKSNNATTTFVRELGLAFETKVNNCVPFNVIGSNSDIE